MFMRPIAIFADQGIGEQDELSHNGGQSNLGGFSGGAQAAVEGLEIGVATDSGDGRHVKRASHMRAAAFDAALPTHLADRS